MQLFMVFHRRPDKSPAKKMKIKYVISNKIPGLQAANCLVMRMKLEKSQENTKSIPRKSAGDTEKGPPRAGSQREGHTDQA